MDRISEPAWVEHVVWWHVYPLGFVGADTTGEDRTPAPRLRRLVPWLDDLLALGANGLALGPVFTSGTHGYDTTDFLEVDPRLGSTEDLVHLIDEAHARGIRVMLDGVFNHVGRGFAPFVEAQASPDGPEAALFRRGPHGGLATFEGHDLLVALDHTNPAVADLVVEVMDHWLDLGADAWRLDAACSVPNAFWARVLPRVRAGHPDVYVVGEVLHGDYAEVVREGMLDSVTQYELWQAVWHGVQEVNLHELDWSLRRHGEFLQTFVPFTFVGNHDVTRVASQVDDERHHPHVLVLLMLLGGTPAIYYGDERGLTGVKEERVGGDDAIRPEFPSETADLARNETFALHQELIGLRRRHPWLHRARSRTVALADATMVLAVSDGEHSLTVALNLSDDPLGVPGSWDVIAGRWVDRADGADGLGVGPHGWAVLATV